MVSLFPGENRFQTQPSSCGGEPYIFIPDLIYSILHIPISWSLSFRHSLVHIYLWMMAGEIPGGPDHRLEGNILSCDRSIRKYCHTCVTGRNWDTGVQGKPVMGWPTKADQMCPKQAESYVSGKLFDFEVQQNAVPMLRRNYQYKLGKREWEREVQCSVSFEEKSEVFHRFTGVRKHVSWHPGVLWGRYRLNYW